MRARPRPSGRRRSSWSATSRPSCSGRTPAPTRSNSAFRRWPFATASGSSITPRPRGSRSRSSATRSKATWTCTASSDWVGRGLASRRSAPRVGSARRTRHRSSSRSCASTSRTPPRSATSSPTRFRCRPTWWCLIDKLGRDAGELDRRRDPAGPRVSGSATREGALHRYRRDRPAGGRAALPGRRARRRGRRDGHVDGRGWSRVCSVARLAPPRRARGVRRHVDSDAGGRPGHRTRAA